MSLYTCEVVFALLANLMCKLWKNMSKFYTPTWLIFNAWIYITKCFINAV